MTTNKSPEELFRREGDNVIVMQSWINQYPMLILTVCVTIVLLYLNIAYPEWTSIRLTVSEGRSFGFPYLVLVPLCMLAAAAFRIMDTRLVLTPEYLIFVDGILRWREKSIRLDYRKIQEIEFEQSIPQRMFGLADITVTPIATSIEDNIRMRGVRWPRAVKDIIRARTSTSDPATGIDLGQ